MKKHIITLILGILLFGIGCGYCTFEIFDFDYIDTIRPDIKIEQETKEYPIGINQSYEIDTRNGVLKFIINDDLTDTMKITASYPKKYAYLNEKEYGNGHRNNFLVYQFHRTASSKDIRNVIEMIIKDLGKKQIYNYADTFTPTVEVHISRENLKYLDFDKDDLWDD